MQNDSDDVMTLLFGIDGEPGFEVPDYSTMQLAGVGDFDQVEGLGFLKRRKKKKQRGRSRGSARPAIRAGAMRRRAGAAARPVAAPRVMVRRAPAAAPIAIPTPAQSPANTSEQSWDEPQEVIDEAPQELLDDAEMPEMEMPEEDEALEGNLGIFKWAKRTINRNKNTLRAASGLIPGAGGVIAQGLLNRGKAPATPGIARPAARPAVQRRPVAKASAGLSSQTLLIGGGLLLAVALIGRK